MNLFVRCAIGLALLTAGCEPQPSSTLGEVTGTVFQDGDPVPNLALEFHPVSGGRPSLAFTDASGQFEAIYLADVPGAKIGMHDVRYELTPGKLADGISPADMMMMERPLIENGAVLDMTRVTVEQGSNHFTFNLIPPPAGESIPGATNQGLSEPSPNIDSQVDVGSPEVMTFVQPIEEERPSNEATAE